MARKRHKPEEIIAKLRQVEVLTGQGKSISEAVKTIAVTETTCPSSEVLGQPGCGFSGGLASSGLEI